jgi:hypothetical protein
LRKGIVLEGGIRPVKARRIVPKRTLLKRSFFSIGGEARKVREVEVVVRIGNRERRVRLVEKVFKPKIGFSREAFARRNPFRDPVMQLKIMREISKLNREKRLGLHIVPTIRLRKRRLRKPTLLVTRLERYHFLPGPLGEQRLKEFRQDIHRQQEVLALNNYFAAADAFVPVLNEKTAKVIAVIADFGNIFPDERALHRLNFPEEDY